MSRLETFMKNTRNKRGITQKEMAIAMGCTGSYLSHIEKLRRPIPHNFVKIVKDTINLSMEELQELMNIVQGMYGEENNQKERLDALKRDFRYIIEEFLVKISSGLIDNALIQEIQRMLQNFILIITNKDDLDNRFI
jgi:transcriptional regulator with XRE-family HTH domain